MIGMLKNNKHMVDILNTFFKMDLSLPLNKRKRIISFLFVLSEIMMLILVFLIRFVPILTWKSQSGIQYLVHSLCSAIKEISLVIVDTYIINITTLIGFYFEMYQIALEKLEEKNENIYFHTLEVLYIRNK